MDQSFRNITKGASVLAIAIFSAISCTNRASVGLQTRTPKSAETWLTTGDETIKLQKQATTAFTSSGGSLQNIEVDASQVFQSVDGFGYTLTGGSVEVLNRLSAAKRSALLNELFSKSDSGIGVSYLRLSIGASDLNSEVFSYDDMPDGATDPTLSKFSLDKDAAVISMLKEILAINPHIKIIAAPWSAPTWMKDNGSTKGGSLKPEYEGVYAQYFVKYIQEMKKNGITVDAITPQNEPLHPGNNPSLYMTSDSQRDFIKNSLGPAFKNAGLTTKIVVYDHNLNKPEYAINILNDATAKSYVDGSAFHLYEGDVSAMSTVHTAHPDRNLYFTEQWTGSTGSFSGDLNWHVKNVIIGTMRNWSKIALEWNLANDQNFEPHTPGGCTQCKGALTVTNSENFTRNVAYYIIAHASKFIPANSKRIASTQTANVSTAAFLTPEGKIVVIAQNGSSTAEKFNIKFNNIYLPATLPAQSVATYIF